MRFYSKMMDLPFELLVNSLIRKFGEERVKTAESLSKYTTFKIGGPARVFFQALKTEDLIFAVREAQRLKIPYFILGGGTNLLVSDKGFFGFVIKNNTNKITIKKYRGFFSKRLVGDSEVLLEVLSGVGVNQLVRYTIEAGLSGLEAFLGQPGTVGGAVYINAHNIKMGEFFGDKIKLVKILTESGQIKEVPRSYFRFGYDESILQRRKEVVLSVTFSLKKGEKDKIWQKANQAMSYRKYTQPLGKGSAGCIFRNISKSEALKIGIPDGITSAGYLIEAVGLKSKQIGGAKISESHANFIINTGNASATDVINLIDLVKRKVKDRFGLELKEEIVYLGLR